MMKAFFPAMCAAVLICALPASAAQGEIGRIKEAAAGIVKGVTAEAEIVRLFGDGYDMIEVGEPVTRDDRQEFALFLSEKIPSFLNPQYPFPAVSQKILFYSFREGEERFLLLVTVNKASGIVEEFKSFDFFLSA